MQDLGSSNSYLHWKNLGLWKGWGQRWTACHNFLGEQISRQGVIVWGNQIPTSSQNWCDCWNNVVFVLCTWLVWSQFECSLFCPGLEVVFSWWVWVSPLTLLLRRKPPMDCGINKSRWVILFWKKSTSYFICPRILIQPLKVTVELFWARI